MWNPIRRFIPVYLHIPSEEEDKLNQRFTSAKRLLDVREQNEYFLIWTPEV